MNRLLINLIILLASGALLVAAFLLAPSFLEQLTPRTHLETALRAPDLALINLEDASFRSQNHRGEILALLFWTSWNPAAADAVLELDRLIRNGDLPDTAVVAINSQEAPDAVRTFLARAAIGIPVYLDADGAAGEAYALGPLPLTVIVDRAGLIAYRHAGPLDAAALARAIAPLRDSQKIEYNNP